MHQLVGLPLPLSQGGTGPLDVRASSRIASVQKQHAGPDVQRLFVLRVEVVVGTGEQELFDLDVAVDATLGQGEAGCVVAILIEHGKR